MKRRVIIKLSVFLLLGTVVNVAVALWGFSKADEPSGAWDEFHSEALDVQTMRLWQRHAIDGWPARPMLWSEHDTLTFESCLLWFAGPSGDMSYSPTSSPTELRRFFRGVGDFRVSRVRCGSPMLAMQFESWDGKHVAPAGLFAPHVGNDGFAIGDIVIPRTMLWPGFAINTLFYAAILLLLFAGPGSVRRWRRLRRGLCAKCAYPVGASEVCTECGAAIRPGGAMGCSHG